MKIVRITDVLTPTEEYHISGIEFRVELIVSTEKTIQKNQNKYPKYIQWSILVHTVFT